MWSLAGRQCPISVDHKFCQNWFVLGNFHFFYKFITRCTPKNEENEKILMIGKIKKDDFVVIDWFEKLYIGTFLELERCSPKHS